MAVTSESTLPAQPVAGTSVYRPLGGNGWTAPHAMYSVLSQLSGDVSGGTSAITLNLDARFMNIVSLIQYLYTGSTSTREVELQIVSDRPTGARHRVRANGTMLFLDALNDQGLISWNPPLLVDAEAIIGTMQNVDGTVANLQPIIYCFQKRALEEVPLNVLLASLPSTQWLNVNT